MTMQDILALLASAHPSIETEVTQALEKAEAYEWMAAAEFYGSALAKLDTVKETALAGEIAEQQAECCFKAAFQSDTKNEFTSRMSLSRDFWRRAGGLYEKADLEARSKISESRARFANFWLTADPDEKLAIIQTCIGMAQEAGHTFELQADKGRLAETLLDLVTFRKEELHLSKERNGLIRSFEVALEISWRIIEDFQGVAGDQTILGAVHALAQLYICAEYILEPPRYEELERRISQLKERINQLLEKTDRPESLALARETSALLAADLDGDVRKALSLLEEGVEKSREVKDRYTVGRLYTSGSSWLRWGALSEEYVDKRREQLQKSREQASNAIENLEPSSAGSWLKLAYGRCAEGFTNLALEVETDLDKKRMLLGKAIDMARKGMTYENHTFLTGVGHELSKALYFLSTFGVGPEEKARLLNEALPIRQEIVRTYERLTPNYSWGRGVMLNYLALLKAELGKQENDPSLKAELLKGAASDMMQCVKLCATMIGLGPVPRGRIYRLAEYHEWSGDVLHQLYQTTSDKTVCVQTIAAYADTISYLSKAENIGHVPRVRWKIAKAYDSQGEYKPSSESFLQAADEYRSASKKIPGLALTFEEFASYMEAWALIEDARLSHDKELYSPAAEAYTKAANLLRASKTWSHLSRHYSACSLLELGEALDRQERNHASMESFNAAQGTFQEASDELDVKLRGTIGEHERSELKEWLEISRTRLKYSLGRAQLEEAKVLDARGDEQASSTKYQNASETFQSLVSEARDGLIRRELETMRLVCEAWAKMKMAEVRGSPELYSEAADTFARLEKTAIGAKSRTLALANASMCKALEYGTTFRRTRDKQLHAEIKRRLETAADFYEEAGVRRAADWTRATQRFFDALTYLGEASAETDTKKKTELYHLAERHLRLAAGLYGDAGYPRKREEVLKQVERAREEKELLMPVEALAENPTVGEVTVAPVSMTGERDVGLDRLESASIVGKMNVVPKEVHAGMTLTLELEIANVGKTTATLLRLENVVPKGFQAAKEETPYLFERSDLNMRGKRLEYLKTHQLKISLKARRKGSYEMKPRIVFVDQKGMQGTYELDPVTVAVKELGVLGWIKGPG